MRAAILSHPDEPPHVEDVPDPHGEVLVDVAAAALNPADLLTAAGLAPGGVPPVPYVIGIEGAGRTVGDGTPVWWLAPGSAAERIAVLSDALVPLPEGLDLPTAAGLGLVGVTAAIPLRDVARVRPGETVLVLGATGPVGFLAVQIARLLGAARVVAAARDAAALRHLGPWADQVVAVPDGAWDAALGEVAGAGFDVVVDPVWGAPAAAAARHAAVGARMVTVGAAAGPATFGSEVLARSLTVHGWRATPGPRLGETYRWLADHVVRQRITLPVDVVPLGDVAGAWARQAALPRRKLVLDTTR